MARLVVGTRGSALALWQADHVIGLLRARRTDVEIERRIISSDGDRRTDVPIESLGGTGVFVRTIEHALVAGEIDLAVHSLKDLPTEQPAGLCVAAVPQRVDPRDAMLTVDGFTLDTLPAGSRVATGSPRRRCQLLHQRPDLTVVPVRGNVDTRVAKLLAGEFDALLLAMAGVTRLGISGVAIEPLDPERCRPAAGQGALGIETRVDDAATLALVEPLGHETSEIEVLAERGFLRRLGGGCMAPATAWANVRGDRIEVQAVVGSLDGRRIVADVERGAADQAGEIGARLARRLLGSGADRLLAEARAGASDPA